MKTKIILLFILIGSFGMSAQNNDPRFAIELNGGPSLALNKIAGATMNVGVGFEGTFHYRFYDQWGAYAGWGWNRFGSNTSFVGENGSFEETGYVVGLQFKQSFRHSPISWYARGGVLLNHIEVENKAGDLLVDSKHGIGYQLATGIYIPIGRNWCMNGGIKFNSLNRGVTHYGGEDRSLNLSYMTLRIGITKMF
ncbi:hypothetical protein MASR1M31_25460 [Porphyromonadaceae bacterium]